MHRTFVIQLTVALVLALGSPPAFAQERGVTRRSSAQVLALAAQYNRALKVALLAQEQSQANVTAEEGAYPLVLQIDGGYDHSSQPAFDQSGRFDPITSDTLSAGTALLKEFPVGTTTSLRLGANRQIGSVGAGGLTEWGPTYGMSATFEIVQPLLRGAGKRVGEAELRQAALQEKIAASQADLAAIDVAKEVLSMYWSYWYADQAVAIEVAARDLAKEQLAEITGRVDAGAVAPLEALSFETRLASLEEDVVAAEAERSRQGFALIGFLGLPDNGTLWLPDDREIPPLHPLPYSSKGTIETVLRRSPEIFALVQTEALAKEKTRVAGEQLRQSLNLKGSLEARILGDQKLSPAFDQLSSDAYSGYVGLVYELPLRDTRKEAQRAAAILGEKIAKENLESTRDRLVAEVRIAQDKVESSQKILVLAEQTAQVAEKQATAQRERFNLGAAIFLQVKEAEEAVRQAHLRLTRSRVDAAIASIELDHLQGNLPFPS